MARTLPKPTERMASRHHRPPVRPPSHPRARKAFLVVAGVLSLMVAAVSGYSIATVRHLENVLDTGGTKVPVVNPSSSAKCDGNNCLKIDPICVQRACDFLVLGSDT